MMRHPSWSVPEPNKAWAWVSDLICAMVFVLLLRDLQEVPGGTHGWIFSCHGWAILFLQVCRPPAEDAVSNACMPVQSMH